MSKDPQETFATRTAPVTDYLDMLARALAAGATWWRQQLEQRNHGLSSAQLDAFERALCFGLAKLLLRNAEQGLSWRSWRVANRRRPDLVLASALRESDLEHAWLPRYSHMWLETTSDQVLVRVHLHGSLLPVQVWPVATGAA